MSDPHDVVWDAVSVSAALERSYAGDQDGFLASVAVLLEAAMPELTKVTRKPKRLFSSEKRTVSVRLTLGDEVYTLSQPEEGRACIATREKIVRGIKLKTEQIPLDEWLAAIADEVRQRAARSEKAYYAMKTFLELR